METTKTRGVNPDGIPNELKQKDQWLCWRAVWDEGEDKFTKVPKKFTGSAGSSTNSETWTTFDKALEALSRNGKRFDGIGFAGLERTEFVGIDIDDCLDPETGEIKEYARRWVDGFKSYTEISPSGKGLRIWIRAEKVPGSWCGSKRDGREFEVYARGRFFTVTGWHLEGTPQTIEHRQDTLDKFMAEEAPPENPKPNGAGNLYTGPSDYRLELEDFLREFSVRVLREIRDSTSERAFAIVCPWAHAHTGGDTSGTRVGQYKSGGLWFACEHAHCDGRVWEHFREELDPEAYRRVEITVGTKKSGRGEAEDTMADQKTKTPPVADRLIHYVLEAGWPLFVDQHGETHTHLGSQAIPISRTNRHLTKLMYKHEGKAPSNDGLIGARRVLDMLAHESEDVRELHTRAAFYEGAVFYQLAPGRVVRIDEDGYRLDPEPPVYFRAVKNLRPLPNPAPGGKLEDLQQWVNLKTDRDIRLFLTYVTLIILAHVARPIFEATGVMGSGKTTASRFIKRLLDPTSNEAVTIDRRDFLQKASHCFIVMLDNQNSLPEWFQDTMCRLVTGESDSKRVLYSDDEDHIWSLKRAILLNGINPPSDRGDVQDRTLPIELERLDKRERLPEDDFWLQFSLKHPELLGAVFDALAGALRERHTVQLEERPRLADWGLYAAALYQSQGWGVEQFVEDWQHIEKTQQQGTLDGSIVAQAVIFYMKNKDRVEMSAAKLHAAIEDHAGEDLALKDDKTWPKTGRTLWKKIREVTPLLEVHGIRAYRSNNCKQGRPIVLDTDFTEPDPPDDKVNDKVNDNHAVNDKVNDKNSDIVHQNADTYGKVNDKPTGERYFGTTLGFSVSDSQEENKNTKRENTQPESSPDLSFTSFTSPSQSKTEPAQKLLEDPPDWLQAQLAKYRAEPSRWLKPTCAAIAEVAYNTVTRGKEVEPVLQSWLERRLEERGGTL